MSLEAELDAARPEVTPSRSRFTVSRSSSRVTHEGKTSRPDVQRTLSLREQPKVEWSAKVEQKVQTGRKDLANQIGAAIRLEEQRRVEAIAEYQGDVALKLLRKANLMLRIVLEGVGPKVITKTAQVGRRVRMKYGRAT